jgi:hypothetical protein
MDGLVCLRAGKLGAGLVASVERYPPVTRTEWCRLQFVARFYARRVQEVYSRVPAHG